MNKIILSKTIGLTGLPGSGKTYACKIFSEILQDKVKIFSADEIVSEIYKDQNLSFELFSNFSWFDEVYEKDLKLINKKFLIKKIIDYPKILINLEEKIHPIVKDKISKYIIENKKNYEFLIFEVPLLFESNMHDFFDINIIIESEESIRFQRIIKRIPENLYEIFLNSHFSQEIKKNLSHYYFINNIDNQYSLKKQIQNFIKTIYFKNFLKS